MLTRDPILQLASEFASEDLDSQHVHGLGGRPRVAPRDVAGFESVLRMARASGWKLLPAGNGTRLGHAPSLSHVDLVLSTRNLGGVLAFEPGDGTLTAWSGSSMHALAELTASGGYDLCPDVAHPARHTLGGVLGAGVSGIDRLARGPLRHHVLGMQVLLADGSLTKTGGRLVKNVTGYDLQRLYSASRGSLCLILEASLRLFPAPRMRSALRLALLGRDECLQLAQRVWDAGIQPQAIIAHPEAGGTGWRCLVFLAGRQASVADETARVHLLCPSAELLHGEDAEAQRLAWRDALEAETQRVSLRLSTLPSRISSLLEQLQLALAAGNLKAALFCQPCLASVHIQFDENSEQQALQRLNETIISWGTSMHWRNAQGELQGAPFGPPGPALRLMQGFKQALDPTGLFAPGVWHGND